jgi:hypothetical protein
MVTVVRSDRMAGRRLEWVGRSGIRLLDLGDHLEYAGQSLGRFTLGADGAIDWNSVAEDSVLFSSSSDAVDLAVVLSRYVSNGALVFFWDSLAIPSVRMEVELAVSHLASITESMAEFWIYSPGDRLLVEHAFAGTVTVVRIPSDP